METEEDERALGAYLEAIEQAQTMVRECVQRRAAQECDTQQITDHVLAALTDSRMSLASGATDAVCSQWGTKPGTESTI